MLARLHPRRASAADLGRSAPISRRRPARRLPAHRWPGNIRELRNVLERAVLLSDGSILGRARPAIFEPAGPTSNIAERHRPDTPRRRAAPHRAGFCAKSGGTSTAPPSGSACRAARCTRRSSGTGSWCRGHDRAMTPATLQRILVVDDETSIRFALYEYLTAHGYAVDCARDRAEGVHAPRAARIRRRRRGPAPDRHGRRRGSGPDRPPAGAQRPDARHPPDGVRRARHRVRGAPAGRFAVVLHKPQPLRELVHVVEGLLAGPTPA